MTPYILSLTNTFIKHDKIYTKENNMVNNELDLKEIAQAIYHDAFVNHGDNNDTTGHLDGPDTELIDKLVESYRQSEKETWFINARDGTKLNAYYKRALKRPEQASRTVLIIHGITSQADNTGPWVSVFEKLGLSVLTPDLRGHGKSATNLRNLGTLDARDMVEWIKEIIKVRGASEEIILFGYSLGAATALSAVSYAQKQRINNLKAIIEDCGYSWLEEFVESYILRQYPQLSYAQVPQVKELVDDILQEQQHVTIGSGVSPFVIAECKLPLLIIHGTEDTTVPISQAHLIRDIYGAGNESVTTNFVEGANHPQSIAFGVENYFVHIKNFLSALDN